MFAVNPCQLRNQGQRSCYRNHIICQYVMSIRHTELAAPPIHHAASFGGGRFGGAGRAVAMNLPGIAPLRAQSLACTGRFIVRSVHRSLPDGANEKPGSMRRPLFGAVGVRGWRGGWVCVVRQSRAGCPCSQMRPHPRSTPPRRGISNTPASKPAAAHIYSTPA